MFRLGNPFALRPTFANLTVAVAVVSLLVGMALPRYADQVKRAHRSHARAALLATAQWMERNANTHGRYPTAATIPGELLLVEGGRYTLSVLSSDGISYRVTATPNATQTSDACGAFQIDHAGLRMQVATFSVPKPLGPMECWKP